MRVGILALGRVATFLFLFSLLPVASHAAVFWDDELEDGNTSYQGMFQLGDCAGATTGQDTTNKVSGVGSLRIGYPSIDITCGGFADRTFPDTLDLWGRFYVRLSPGFIVDDVGTKMMNNSTTASGLSFWWLMLFGSSELQLAAQGFPTVNDATNYSSNVGNGDLRTSPEGGFVCIETRIKLNTIGSADGVIEAYKNGVRIMHHMGIEMRRAGTYSENALFTFNRMFRQLGGGNINYDRLALGNSRIGCLGLIAAPTNLNVK